MTPRSSRMNTCCASLTAFKRKRNKSFWKSSYATKSISTNGTTTSSTYLMRAQIGHCSRFAAWKILTEATSATTSFKYVTSTTSCWMFQTSSTKEKQAIQWHTTHQPSQILASRSITLKKGPLSNAFRLKASSLLKGAILAEKPLWSPS